MSLRILWSIASVEARKRMSYRLDFWIHALVGLSVQLGVAYLITLALYRESGATAIAGFSLREMMAYYVFVVVVARVVTATEMDHSVSQDIYEGALSRYLLYPTSYPAVKYAQQIGAMAPAFVQCVVFAAWMPFVFGVPAGISAGGVAMGAVSVLVASLLQFMMILPIQAVSFWADNVWSLMVAYRIVSRILGGMMIPLALFPAWLRDALPWTPFPYLFAMPVDAVLGRVNALQWAQGTGIALAWCAVLAMVTSVVWRRGDLQYTGVGQ